MRNRRVQVTVSIQGRKPCSIQLVAKQRDDGSTYFYCPSADVMPAKSWQYAADAIRESLTHFLHEADR